jgi:hypothetical protein
LSLVNWMRVLCLCSCRCGLLPDVRVLLVLSDAWVLLQDEGTHGSVVYC